MLICFLNLIINKELPCRLKNTSNPPRIFWLCLCGFKGFTNVIFRHMFSASQHILSMPSIFPCCRNIIYMDPTEMCCTDRQINWSKYWLKPGFKYRYLSLLYMWNKIVFLIDIIFIIFMMQCLYSFICLLQITISTLLFGLNFLKNIKFTTNFSIQKNIFFVGLHVNCITSKD